MSKYAKKSGKRENVGGRLRNFAFMLYDESCNQAWKEILKEMCIRCIWIYHDKDTMEGGELKKPHYHVMIMRRGPIAFLEAQKVVNELGAANGHIEVVRDVRGYARYMCHMDEKDKHKYAIDDVHELGGADFKSLIGISKEDKFEALREIIALCNDRKYNNYCAVVDYCLENNDDWVELLLDIRFGRLIQDYIKCKSWVGDYRIN